MNSTPIVLKKIVLSEKAAFLGGSRVYSFIVADSANKVDISRAIFAQYNVTPVKINTIRIATRPGVKRNRKIVVRGYKKAMITLKEGEVIEFA